MIDKSYYQRLPNMPDRTAAGGIVCRLNPSNGQLLCALVREKGLRSFVLPKGGVEAGESLEEAARREIGEEAGIHQLDLVQKLGTLERMTFRKTSWSTTHVYLFVTDQIEFQPTDIEHIYNPMWMPLDKIENMFWPEQQNFLKENKGVIQQAIKLYKQGKNHDTK